MSSTGQDPHSFEPSARDQLTVQRADLIIENGGGYDAFIDALIESSGSEAPVITAVEFSHDWPDNAGHDAESEGAHTDEHGDHGHVEGFNEHVWYDPHTVEHLAEGIAHELSELLPGRMPPRSRRTPKPSPPASPTSRRPSPRSTRRTPARRSS